MLLTEGHLEESILSIAVLARNTAVQRTHEIILLNFEVQYQIVEHFCVVSVVLLKMTPTVGQHSNQEEQDEVNYPSMSIMTSSGVHVCLQ